MADHRDEQPREPHRDTDEATAPADTSTSEPSPVEEQPSPDYPAWAKVPEPKPKYGTAPQLKLWFGTSPSNAHRWSNPKMKRRRPVPRRQGPDGAIEFEVAGILAREEERKERLRSGHNPAATLRQNSGSCIGTKRLGARNHDGADLGSDAGAESGHESVVRVGAGDSCSPISEDEYHRQERLEEAQARALIAKKKRKAAEKDLLKERFEAANLAQELFAPASSPPPVPPVAHAPTPEEEDRSRHARINERAGLLLQPAMVKGRLDVEDRVERGELDAKQAEEVLSALHDTLDLHLRVPYDLLPRELAYSEHQIELIAKHLGVYVSETIDFLLVERGLLPSRLEGQS